MQKAVPVAMNPLKLIALDEEDLEVVSSHLQDAVLRVDDLVYMPAHKRFVGIVNRFDWPKALTGSGAGSYRRKRSALRFDRVLGARLKNLKPSTGGKVLSLLAIRFEAGDPPSGHVTLTFSGDASIRLQVECIEAELRDLGPAWRTRSKPRHPGVEPGDAGS